MTVSESFYNFKLFQNKMNPDCASIIIDDPILSAISISKTLKKLDLKRFQGNKDESTTEMPNSIFSVSVFESTQ